MQHLRHIIYHFSSSIISSMTICTLLALGVSVRCYMQKVGSEFANRKMYFTYIPFQKNINTKKIVVEQKMRFCFLHCYICNIYNLHKNLSLLNMRVQMTLCMQFQINTSCRWNLYLSIVFPTRLFTKRDNVKDIVKDNTMRWMGFWTKYYLLK